MTIKFDIMKKIAFSDYYYLTRAVIDGNKTVTRRILPVQQPTDEFGWKVVILGSTTETKNKKNIGKFHWVRTDKSMLNVLDSSDLFFEPAYKVGDIVAIAQCYYDVFRNSTEDVTKEFKKVAGWNNKMFVKADRMPHQIKITGLHIERLQDITDHECMREGVRESTAFGRKTYIVGGCLGDYETPREAFAALMDKLCGRGTWESNPCVWVYEFEKVK